MCGCVFSLFSFFRYVVPVGKVVASVGRRKSATLPGRAAAWEQCGVAMEEISLAGNVEG